MGFETVDRRFILIGEDGELRYPYKKSEKASGRYGFAVSPPGLGDKKGSAAYVSDLEDVIRRVVLDGWKVKTMSIDKPGRQSQGSTGLGKRKFQRYWLHDDFKHLVKGADIQPTSLPGL